MKIFSVSWVNPATNKCEYSDEIFTLSIAKKLMKDKIKEGMQEVSGSITKVWSNGDWENCGAIQLKGSNKTFIANTRQTTRSYA